MLSRRVSKILVMVLVVGCGAAFFTLNTWNPMQEAVRSTQSSPISSSTMDIVNKGQASSVAAAISPIPHFEKAIPAAPSPSSSPKPPAPTPSSSRAPVLPSQRPRIDDEAFLARQLAVLPSEPVEDVQAARTKTSDSAFDSFTCPPEFRLEIVKEGSKITQKRCIATLQAMREKDVAWGLVCGKIWQSDVGYWVGQYSVKCQSGFSRGTERGLDVTYCTKTITYPDVSQNPPLHRIFPICPPRTEAQLNGEGTVKVGFGIAKASGDQRDQCPPGYESNAVICTKPAEPVPFESVLAANNVNKRVIMAVASFDYAPLARGFHAYHAAIHGNCVIILTIDLPAYSYLKAHGIPAVYMPSIQALSPFCLRRLHMTNWRASNDVKVRGLIQALELGYSVTMMDLDTLFSQVPDWDSWDKEFEIVTKDQYSFMWVHNRPTPNIIRLWKHVLDEVLDNGWDQSAYGSWKAIAGDLKEGDVGNSLVWRISNSNSALWEEGERASGRPIEAKPLPNDFVRWPVDHKCSSMEWEPSEWQEKGTCIMLLSVTAVALDRIAVLPEPAKYMADTKVIKAIFPALSESFATRRGYNDSITVSQVPLKDLAQAHKSGSFSSDARVVEMPSDSPDKLLKALWPVVSPELKWLSDQFIAPPPPVRAKLKCLRGVTETGPTCSRACAKGQECRGGDPPLFAGCDGTESKPKLEF